VDIFISHRKEDKFAVKTVRSHVDGFGAFVDVDILGGELWEERLRDEVGRCKVFLVVAGPGWMQRRGDLSNPGDWVRQELQIVLDRPDALVIPVLLGGVSRDEFIKPLRAGFWARLLGRDLTAAQRLHGRLHSHQLLELDGTPDSDKAKLVGLIKPRLAEAARSRERVLPPRVPYLCDRKSATTQVKERFASGARSIVVPGYEREAHDEFLERLLADGLLARLFASPDGVDVRRLRWDRTLANKGLFAKVAEDALGEELGTDDSVAALTAALTAQRRPQVFVLEVIWSDLAKRGPDLIGELADALRAALQRLAPKLATLVWVNVTYESPAGQQLSEEQLERLQAVEALPPVGLSDFKEWAGLAAVKSFISSERKTRFEDAISSRFAQQPHIHMRDFALAVEQACAPAGR
jgi:hypothetical protein